MTKKTTLIATMTFLTTIMLIPVGTDAFAISASAVWGTNADQAIEDGTTYANQTDANSSWVSQDTNNLFMDSTNDYVTTKKPSITGKTMYYDLGDLSNESFTLRLPLVVNTITHSSEGSNPFHDQLRIGIMNTSNQPSSTDKGIFVIYELTPWQSDGIKLNVYDGSPSYTWTDASGNEKLTSGNDYCIEVRNDAILNTAYLDLYSSNDCSGSAQHTLSQTHSGSLTGMRYLIMYSDYLETSSNYDIDWDNLELFVEPTMGDLQSQIDDLQSQITSLNATVATLNTQVSVMDTLLDYIDTFLDGIFLNYNPPS